MNEFDEFLDGYFTITVAIKSASDAMKAYHKARKLSGYPVSHDLAKGQAVIALPNKLAPALKKVLQK
jgi:hypothetical protein